MPYCLARHDDWHCNIVDDKAVTHIEGVIARRRNQSQPFPLHKYVHHGLSSQAMLFNLVGPLAARDDLLPLASVMERAGIPWPEGDVGATFEYEDRSIFNEQQVQPTSVDLVIGDPSKPGSLFIECKLVETGFGGCSVFADGDCDGSNPATDFDSCYLHHIGRTYLTALKEAGLFEGKLGKDTNCTLVNHYQFFRELLLAVRKQGFFVLLGDERSPVFVNDGGARQRGIWPHLFSVLPDDLQKRAGFVTVQSVVEEIVATGRHPWIVEFRKKYGLMPESRVT
jgi:POLQ-like helicase